LALSVKKEEDSPGKKDIPEGDVKRTGKTTKKRVSLFSYFTGDGH
jgi:hypothetical protein